MKVALLGASPKPDRYAYKAFKLLTQHGHDVFLVNPTLNEIEGSKVYPTLTAVPESVHTLTLYVGGQRLPPLLPDLLALKPKRVIFNPGTEEPSVMQALEQAGIEVLEACTLVLLRTNQF